MSVGGTDLNHFTPRPTEVYAPGASPACSTGTARLREIETADAPRKASGDNGDRHPEDGAADRVQQVAKHQRNWAGERCVQRAPER